MAITSTTQQELFTNKRFSTGQVAVRKTVVDGSIVNTEYPLSSSTGSFNIGGVSTIPFFVSAGTASTTTLLFNHSVVSGYANNSSYVGHIGLFLRSGTTASASTACSGHQLFMYKIVSSTPNTMTLDRSTPDLSGQSINFAAVAIFSSGVSSASTFIPNSSQKSLMVAPTIDTLETMEIPALYSANTKASGLLKYFNTDEETGETKLFILPTYSGWNTVEMWKPSTVRLSLPYVLWHAKPSAGITLIDSSDTMIDEVTNLLYSNLTIENYGTIVGRVFHEKKIIVIDDVELQAALNYLSNRNYTLPAPALNISTTTDSLGGVQSGTVYYATYRCRDSSSYPTGSYFGTTNVQPLHCRYIQQLTATTTGYKLRVQAPASSWYVATRGANNTGFTAPVVDILFASGTTGSSLANATWYVSGNAGTYANLNTGIEIQFSTGGTIPLASFSGLSISGTSNLRFGDDPTILGYFSATSQSTIYKMSATLVARNNEFNATQNKTFDSGTNESVYITEAALYNENNELLMTGKLNTPIEKNDKKFVTIKMELDL